MPAEPLQHTLSLLCILWDLDIAAVVATPLRIGRNAHVSAVAGKRCGRFMQGACASKAEANLQGSVRRHNMHMRTLYYAHPAVARAALYWGHWAGGVKTLSGTSFVLKSKKSDTAKPAGDTTAV